MTLRVVLDSNVIISGFLFGGPPGAVLSHAVAGSIRCFTSLPLLDEVRDVLQRPKFGLSPDQALRVIEELHDLCEVVRPRQRVLAVAVDPDDNAVIECAVAAKADLVVSRNAHLHALPAWKGIRNVYLAETLKEMKSI